MSNFDWPRMHKDEEHIEREAYNCVEDAITRHYEIEDISELTEKQWEEIHAWQEANVSESRHMTGFVCHLILADTASYILCVLYSLW